MKAIMSLRQLPGNTRTSESATLSDRRYPVMRPALPIVGMRSGSGPLFPLPGPAGSSPPPVRQTA